MLRGLSSKYRHAIPAITSRQPPHSFLSARSYLLLEEQYDKEHAKTATQHALLASGGSKPAPSPDGSSTNTSSTNQQFTPQNNGGQGGSAPRHNNSNRGGGGGGGRGRGRGRGRDRSQQQQHQGGSNARGSPAWTPGVNPWTGMVQAWQMPFRTPATSVLGPRPGTASNEAYFAA
ncbi:glycine-rich protein DOT1-like [Sorghum bicolor]|uniref:glycine-rich protein DOT1-like n=1 Tax=Sorghum bicolor TaxID=4558 RepID=UPI000B426886|nr:glycine-rich protein DOT1-like [Sorghum bicolor]|eukprot:XP_021311906.1 glycine-rich protein DOT1-like [Sorghum bicolor]